MASLGELFLLVSSGFAAGIALYLAYLVLANNPGNQRSWVFAIWMFASGTTALLLFVLTILTELMGFSPGTTLFGVRMVELRVIILLYSVIDPCISLHFAFLFFEKTFFRGWRLAILYFPAAMIYGIALGSGLTLLFLLFGPYFMAMGLVSLGVVLRLGFSHGNEPGRNTIVIGLSLLLVVPMLFWVQLVVLLSGFSTSALGAVIFIIESIAIPVAELLFAYAILRHSILGAETRVKRTIVVASVMAILLSGFIVIEEILEGIISGLAGEESTFAGVVAAFTVVIFFQPLERSVRRGVERMLPADDMAHNRDLALAAYRATYLTAYEDGVISAKEQMMLDRLRDAMNLSSEDVEAIIVEVQATNHFHRGSQDE